MVFQQSRVKNNFDEWKAEAQAEAENKTKNVRNGEKARAFLLQLEICYEETQAIQNRESFRDPAAGRDFRRKEEEDFQTAKGRKTDCKKFKRTRA